MKQEKITIDFATYESVFAELAKWLNHLEVIERKGTGSEKAKARAKQRVEKVQALLDALVDAEFNEE